MLPRRFQSIDRKLPLLASGLVVLTVIVLGWTAYLWLERALLSAAQTRLFGTAQVIAQMVQRPRPRADSLTQRIDQELRRFAKTGARDSALRWLSRTTMPGDTTKFYAAFVDTMGTPRLVYQRPPAREPQWARTAIARGEIGGDTTSVGPIENVADAPVVTLVHPLLESGAPTARRLGFVIDARTISSARSARAFRRIIGDSLQLLIGDPRAGVWTDLERVESAPPITPLRDTSAAYPGGVGAAAKVVGTHWMVWVGQPTRALLAPARAFLWSMVPIGLLVGLVAAVLMWRMAHRITHPIVALTDAVEDIARDSHVFSRSDEMRAEASGADEVTRLRYAFERMASRVAERQALEQQLRHAQKMDAIGRLAGGVAHDFNNLLTAIRSYADLMIEDMPDWDTKRGDVEEIRKAAQRASALTAQLLAFSRKQMLLPRVLDTRAVLTDVETMLRRLLIEDITLTVDAPAGLWPVKADRGQLEQVIVNLAVNARDAMPQGGALTISAKNEVVSEPRESKHGVVPSGEYVSVRVTDTGQGMDAMTQSRVFEPFFTTKSVGQGTGLGLATVHGIVAQSGGHIAVDSLVGAGTTFTVYLPRAHEAPQAEHGGTSSTRRGNHETILLVEDEPAVRSLAKRVLTRSGFLVLESTSPTHAVRLASQHALDIQLVLTDVVMPEMSGPALVEKLGSICPRARVLYTSGYTDDEVFGRGLAEPGIQLLQKPFSAQQLVERVRTALDSELSMTASRADA